MTDLDELKALAEDCEKYGGLRTPEYEYAANPKTILDLIERLEKAEGALSNLHEKARAVHRKGAVKGEQWMHLWDALRTASRALGGGDVQKTR